MLFLALLVPLLQLVAAAPTTDVTSVEVANRTNTLEKRGDGTGFHLVNCDGFGGEGTILPPRSFVVFCPNDSDCNQQPPDPNTLCVMSSNFIFTWEGAAQGCTFPTGVKLDWFVNSDAQSQPNFVHVGHYSDGGDQFRAYAGFKDDQHVMFDQGSSQCRSIYYFI